MTAKHDGYSRIAGDPWVVARNAHRAMWMIGRDGSPAIAFCLVKADAERIAQLLNEADHE